MAPAVLVSLLEPRCDLEHGQWREYPLLPVTLACRVLLPARDRDAGEGLFDPLIDSVFSPSEAAAAFDLVHAREGFDRRLLDSGSRADARRSGLASCCPRGPGTTQPRRRRFSSGLRPTELAVQIGRQELALGIGAGHEGKVGVGAASPVFDQDGENRRIQDCWGAGLSDAPKQLEPAGFDRRGPQCQDSSS